jgi:PGF-pre-PGF domain-containing protein
VIGGKMIINSTHKGHTFRIAAAVTLLAVILLAGVASAEVIQVNISIDENNINIQSSRAVYVDILSTPSFNASARVNISTVTFMGAPVEDTGNGSIYQDVNKPKDDLKDLHLKFTLQNTVIQCVDLRGYLFGTTYDGQTIYGSDIIHITAPKNQICTPGTGPNITFFDPPYSPVINNVSESRNFSIKVNQTVNVFWYIGVNGNITQVNGSVNESTYTNNSASLGGWNIIVYANNSNGSDVQSWGWIVSKVNTSISVNSSQNPSAFGQPVTFTATIAPVALETVTPTGTVEFFNGSTLLGSAGLSGTTATFSTNALGVGSNSITAVYSGDNNFSNITSPAITQTVVTKETPTITWSNPADITYPAALSGIQLNAIATNATGATVDGNFTYIPPAGTVLSAGNGQTLSVTFTPTDTSDYNTASKSVTINVLQATPTITWSNPADIVYGTALSSTQLNASASVNGTFTYNPTAGTILSAGSQTLSTIFTPQDTTNYTIASASVDINVNQATPTITWGNPADITYGTALSGAQLDATASVAGTFAYNPVVGAILGAGTWPLSSVFTPTDITNYTTASANVNIKVNQAIPTITWATPADITYGTALNSTQLNAFASYNGSTVPGNFTYTPSNGTVLSAGTHILLANFTPIDTINYTNASANVNINVSKASPTITWNNPADIVYGTALNSTQLNTSASVPGIFAYTPDTGTVLGVGTQTLSVVFIPTDATNYSIASADVKINVSKALPMIAWNNPANIAYGTALSETQLNATASVAGSFTYTPAAEIVLDAGDNQNLHVDFTPTDTENYTTSSADVKINVLKASTTTTVASSINPSVFGQVVNFTATVSTDAGTSGGNVQFKIDGSNLGSPVGLSNGSATSIGNSSLSVGTHTITAEYSGDGNFNSSTSLALTQIVNTASTTTTSSSAGASTGSSGCGSGVITKENLSNIKQYETREVYVHISEGTTVFSFSTLGIVNKAGFTAKTNEGCTAVRGEVLKERPSQATSDAPGIGTVYFNVWLGPWGYGESSKIENPYVVFRVPDKKNNESVKLMMYKDNSWIDLKTEKIDIGTYRAYTGGFGSFAIVETATANETPYETSIQSTPTPVVITNEQAPQKPTNLALILVVFILIIGMVIGYRQYRKGLSRKNTNLRK